MKIWTSERSKNDGKISPRSTQCNRLHRLRIKGRYVFKKEASSMFSLTQKEDSLRIS